MALPNIKRAFSIRDEGILLAGGQVALFYSGSLLSGADAQAAQLPPASLIITPQGVQHIVQDAVTGTYNVQNVNNISNAFQDVLYFFDASTSDEDFVGGEWNGIGVDARYSSNSSLAVGNGEISLPAGRFYISLQWQIQGQIHLVDVNTGTEYFITPDAYAWQGYFELFAPATVAVELYVSQDETFTYDGIQFLEGELKYAPTAN